jgi:Tol biopolymer transport system component
MPTPCTHAGTPRGGSRAPAGVSAAAALAAVAVLATLCLTGCDVQNKLLPIPVGGFWERLTPATVVDPYYPDVRGDRVLFGAAQGNNFHLGWIRLDGSGDSLFAGVVGRNDIWPRWVNDSLVVFGSNRSGNYDIWYLNVRSGATWQLTTETGSEVSPAPRPGSPGLVYVEAGSSTLNGRVVLLPDTAAVTTDLHFLSPDSLKAGEPDWDPAGTRVCFSAQGSDTTRHIWTATISAGDTTLTQLTTGPYQDLSPRWSPDGLHIVFVSSRDGIAGVWVVAAAGESAGLREVATEVPPSRSDTPAWSGDGHTLVVSSNGRGGQQALWRILNVGL